MSKIRSLISQFLREDDGPTSVEYAVMLAVILILCLVAILQAGNVQRLLWIDSAETLRQAVNGN